MKLSDFLVSKFVKETAPKEEKRDEVTVYGTVKVIEDGRYVRPDGTIIEIENGKYVQLDGSDFLTPFSEAVAVEDGERVLVMIKDHSAVLTNNLTSPATNITVVNGKITEIGFRLDQEISNVNKEIDAVDGRVDTTNGRIDSTNGRIDNLDSDLSGKINEAAKKATNYMVLDSSGLNIGNYTSGAWNGSHTRITNNSFDVVGQDGNINSSFGEYSVKLGRQLYNPTTVECGYISLRSDKSQTLGSNTADINAHGVDIHFETSAWDSKNVEPKMELRNGSTEGGIFFDFTEIRKDLSNTQSFSIDAYDYLGQRYAQSHSTTTICFVFYIEIIESGGVLGTTGVYTCTFQPARGIWLINAAMDPTISSGTKYGPNITSSMININGTSSTLTFTVRNNGLGMNIRAFRLK